MPLVYSSPVALEQARRLLPRGQVLEVEVANAILAGSASVWGRRGKVYLDGLVATVERQPGRLRPRPHAWIVKNVRPSGGGSGEPAPDDPD